MDGISIAIIVTTTLLVHRMVPSSRKQKGYKGWEATSSGKEGKATKVKWEHGAWLRHTLGETVPRMQYVQKFDEPVVVWCANLLGVETARLREIPRDISEHYREFRMRKRKGSYRVISAPDKELQSIQTTVNSRMLSSVTMTHPAAVGLRSGHSAADNTSSYLGKRYILEMDIHDSFFSIRSRRMKRTFEEVDYPENVSKVLGVLYCLYRHLSQGASISPVLSNIMGYEVDKKLTALAAEYGLTCTRYAGDLIFSGDVFPKERIIPRIKQIIRDEKSGPNHKKTRSIDKHGRRVVIGVSTSSGAKLIIFRVREGEIQKNVYLTLIKGSAEHQCRIGSSDLVYLKQLIGRLCYW